jgi:hypothetical protein
VQDALEQEREGAEQIMNCLMNTEDQLEFEQMHFEKEKKDLGGTNSRSKRQARPNPESVC